MVSKLRRIYFKYQGIKKGFISNQTLTPPFFKRKKVRITPFPVATEIENEFLFLTKNFSRYLIPCLVVEDRRYIEGAECMEVEDIMAGIKKNDGIF